MNINWPMAMIGEFIMKNTNSINELLMKAIQIREAIGYKILALPDNEDIQRQGEGCFTINSSKLDSNLNLSPEYYDFKVQYEIIAKVLSERPIEKTIDWLNELIEKETFYYKSNTIKLNPKVVEYLKGIIE